MKFTDLKEMVGGDGDWVVEGTGEGGESAGDGGGGGRSGLGRRVLRRR